MERYNKHEHHKLCFLNCFASILVLSIFMVRRLFWIAFALPSKLYRLRPLFTHKNGCGGAISVTEGGLRRADLPKVGRHISDGFCASLWSRTCAVPGRCYNCRYLFVAPRKNVLEPLAHSYLGASWDLRGLSRRENMCKAAKTIRHKGPLGCRLPQKFPRSLDISLILIMKCGPLCYPLLFTK